MFAPRIVRLAGLLVLVCQAGCLTLGSGGTTAHKAREPVQLPAKESAPLCVSVADTLARQGHLAEAIGQLRQAQQFDPTIDVSPRLARLLARGGQDSEALAEFDRAVQAHAKDAELWNDLGYFHYEHGRWADAERALRQALAVEPNYPKAWMNLGLALGQQDRHDDSLEAFRHAVRPPEALCNLAFVLCTQGKVAEAQARYEEALRLDPGLKLARAGLARLEAQKKAGAEAANASVKKRS